LNFYLQIFNLNFEKRAKHCHLLLTVLVARTHTAEFGISTIAFAFSSYIGLHTVIVT